MKVAKNAKVASVFLAMLANEECHDAHQKNWHPWHSSLAGHLWLRVFRQRPHPLFSPFPRYDTDFLSCPVQRTF